MKSVRITIMDVEGNVVEYALDTREQEILKDCLEAGLESYEGDPDVAEMQDLASEL